jgi:hypothetical protein
MGITSIYNKGTTQTLTLFLFFFFSMAVLLRLRSRNVSPWLSCCDCAQEMWSMFQQMYDQHAEHRHGKLEMPPPSGDDGYRMLYVGKGLEST